MLIPLFCSIARKGIRELDTTEKENHHGEKDYASFFFSLSTLHHSVATSVRRAQGKNFQIGTRRSKGIFRVGFRSGTKALVTIATSGRKKRRQLYQFYIRFVSRSMPPFQTPSLVFFFLFSFFFYFVMRYSEQHGRTIILRLSLIR